MPFWLPQGAVLLRLIEGEIREQLAKRELADQDPQVLDEERHRSGHWDNREEHVLRRARRARARAAPVRARSR